MTTLKVRSSEGIRLQEYLLDKVCLWPRETYSSKKYVAFAVLMLIPVLNYVSYWSQFILDRGNLGVAAQVLAACCLGTGMICKAVSGLLQRQQMRKVLLGLEKLDLLSQHSKESSAACAVARNAVRKCKTFNKVMVIFINCNIIVVAIKPLFEGENRSLLIRAYFPFDQSRYFFAAYLVQLLGIGYCNFISCAVDMLPICLTYLFCGHYECLKMKFAKIDEKSVFRNELQENEQVIYDMLKECVIYHNEIIKCLRLFDELTKYNLFVQFFMNTLALGIASLRIIVIGNVSFEFVFFAFIICYTLSYMYLYCYTGQMLIEESTSLSEVSYLKSVHAFSPRLLKVLLITITNTNRSVALSIGNFAPLSINTFLEILKFTYSFLMLLVHMLRD